jgi:cobalamin biosynthesis Mg chelatase CobN
MRPTPRIKTARITACACAALTLALPAVLPGAAAAASEAGNPFAPTSPAAPAAAEQASGAGKAAGASPTSATGAGKAPAQAPGVGRAATATAPAKGAILPSQVTGATGAKTVKTANTSTSTQESSSGTNTSEILVLIAAGLLLVGIAYMILRDARSVAPVTEGLATGGTRNPEGRLRKRRAQAKAARLQRKRHRKR